MNQVTVITSYTLAFDFWLHHVKTYGWAMTVKTMKQHGMNKNEIIQCLEYVLNALV